eukprot:gene746-924_t
MGIGYRHYKQIFQKNLTNLPAIPFDLEVLRLEDRLFQLHSKEQINGFIDSHPIVAKNFLGIVDEKSKGEIINKLYEMVHNEHLQALYQEVKRQYKQIDTLQHQLTTAFKYLKNEYPAFEQPQIATIVTGMGTDLHVSKQLMIVGLDYFLGEGASIRPVHLPNYLLQTYQPEFIVPKLIFKLSHYFNAGNLQDKTLLQDMIYAGKAYYFVKTLLPKVPDTILLGYTLTQCMEVEKNQRIVWQHFIDQSLFYESKHSIKKRYLSERPFTSEIGPGCPGNLSIDQLNIAHKTNLMASIQPNHCTSKIKK